MKKSPLQLEAIEYPTIEVRAIPNVDESRLGEALPISLRAGVSYTQDGNHFVFLAIAQKDKSYPYMIEIQAFSQFRIDSDGCKNAYKDAFNPAVVAVNAARILYSSAREMLAIVSARAPYGAASLPGAIIEIPDVDIEFEDDSINTVLQRDFCMSLKEIEMLKKQAEAASTKHALKGRKTKKPKPVK